MPAIAIRKCRKCGYTWTGHLYNALGDPLQSCPGCGQLFRMDGVNEWVMLNSFERFGYWLHHLFRPFTFSLLGAFGGVAVLMYAGHVDGNSPHWPWGWIVFFYIVTLAIALPWKLRRVRRAIRESEERIRDPAYLQRLKHYGLLK